MGIGKKLLAESERIMKTEGIERVSLTTDYYDNEQTVGFYNSMGYETLYEFVTYPKGRCTASLKPYRIYRNEHKKVYF